jgi:peptide alpha-N-acetyltransferase
VQWIPRSVTDIHLKALDDEDNLIGVIVCKLEPHRGGPMRGYIAMLATRKDYRGHGIATSLVKMAIEKMVSEDADEVNNLTSGHDVLLFTDGTQIALETEVDNIPSLRIYENLGFIRTKRLHRYYLNGNTAFRLILYLKPGIPWRPTYPPDYPMPASDPAATQGHGLMGEDLYARQAAQVQIEDVYGEQFDVTKLAKDEQF